MPWINHLPPVCWSTFGILVWNDSVYVNLTQWWYFFIIFEYILHISTPHIMVFCFPLPYFPLSTSALFFAKYSCTHIVYRRSLVTFYWDAFQKCIWALQILGCISICIWALQILGCISKCIWALQILGCISKMYMSSTDTGMHFKNVYELYRYWDAFQKCIWALQILGCISKCIWALKSKSS